MPQSEAVRQGFRQIRNVILIVGAILLLATVLIGWFGDRRSCIRQVDIRRAIIDNRKINQNAIGFWEARGEHAIAARLQQRVDADARIQQLDCNRVFPGT